MFKRRSLGPQKTIHKFQIHQIAIVNFHDFWNFCVCFLFGYNSRVSIVWKNEISEKLKNGQNILCVIHGTSIRAFCTLIDQIDEKKVEKFEVPTGLLKKAVFKMDTSQRISTDLYPGHS